MVNETVEYNEYTEWCLPHVDRHIDGGETFTGYGAHQQDPLACQWCRGVHPLLRMNHALACIETWDTPNHATC